MNDLEQRLKQKGNSITELLGERRVVWHPTMRIYTASRTRHAEMWRVLRAQGWPIISSWIDEAGEGESDSIPDLWERCIVEAKSATDLILYAEASDHLKGALVEVGAALACGVNVYIVNGGGDPCPSIGSFRHHPLVREMDSVMAALEAAKVGRI